ncbi:MAG: hypothetical protein U0231_20230 [Nitrospiraceae bacterium]
MASTEEPKLREFASRGGQVVFRLPAHWKMEPHGNGSMYYADSQPGTLFLDVLTFRIPQGADSLIQTYLDEGGYAPLTLDNGRTVGRRETRSVEAGEQVASTGWILCFVQGDDLILPMFSFAVEAKYASQAEIRSLALLIEGEVLACRLANPTLQPASKRGLRGLLDHF